MRCVKLRAHGPFLHFSDLLRARQIFDTFFYGRYIIFLMGVSVACHGDHFA